MYLCAQQHIVPDTVCKHYNNEKDSFDGRSRHDDCVSAQAQKIQIVDNDGNAIPLVSVMTENGNYIGTTDFDGVLNDVKGAAKVALTHVAYKPQLVTVASLQNGRVTMEDLDYGLDEDGQVLPENFVMEQCQLEYDKKGGDRKITVIYLYATDKGYMDKDEVKARGKEISKGRKGDMSLDELAEYERAHNIPVLSPEQQKAIRTLTKQTGKKK